MDKEKEVKELLDKNNIRFNCIQNTDPITETQIIFGDNKHAYIVDIKDNKITNMYYFYHISHKNLSNITDFTSIEQMLSHYSNLVFI